MKFGIGLILGFMLCAYALDVPPLEALDAVWQLVAG